MLSSIADLEGLLPQLPVEPAALFFFTDPEEGTSSQQAIGRVCAPPAVRPSDIAVGDLPRSAVRGYPVRLFLALQPTYPAQSPSEVEAALGMVAAHLSVRVVGTKKDMTTRRLLRVVPPLVDVAAARIILNVFVPPAGDGPDVDVVCVESICLLGESIPLDEDKAPLQVAVGARDDTAGASAAWRASEKGDALALLYALCNGSSAGEQNHSGDSCLHVAAREGHLDAVRVLVAAGTALNRVNQSKNTALQWACNRGHASIVEFMLRLPGIDVTAYDVNEDSNLAIAAMNGHADICRLLLAAGAEPNSRNKWKNTPLQWACNKGHTEVAKLLLAVPGIDAVATDANADTNLAIAAMNGRTDVVELLLAAGVDPSTKNKWGNSPLQWACNKGFAEVAKLLLAVPGIDIAAPDANGDTNLAIAAMNGRADVVKLLLAAGASASTKNKWGNSPLQWACNKGFAEVTQLLLAVPDIDIAAPDVNGDTNLAVAAMNGKADVVALLLAAGADTATKNKWGNSPLQWACSKGHSAVVRTLLSVPSIDVESPNEDADTNLMLASRNGHFEICELLVAAGADAKRKNARGRTARDAAKSNGHSDIVALLESLSSSSGSP